MAQSYPNWPVKIIVPFAAGGGPDVETRRLVPKLAEALAGAVVVENRVGAAGMLDAEVVTQAPADSTIKSAKNLEALIHSKSGELNYGSGGIGTSSHIAGASFVGVLKLNAAHVSYRGSAELVPALLYNQVQYAFPIAETSVPFVKTGKVRALVVRSAKRMSSLPEVATRKAVADPELRAHDLAAGTEPELSESPEVFARFMVAESQNWRRLIQMAGI